MARSNKGLKRIVVRDIEYRWSVKGDDGYISVCISPADGSGPSILSYFGYHESWTRCGDGSRRSNGDQIIITNRIVRRLIDYCLDERDYSPLKPGSNIRLTKPERCIVWSDAVRRSPDG